ncbi:capping protein inhibiting regulator of actin dynamics isoform X5 [Trematomus bernacchii]|uniref:capping protein inhibiting regulator of actin dynamics isoform X5 n=1 Tax=Trematomus bernacchii TaxID=40690 RepID=UPI00146DCB90|nr:capping protein inhibiting regulator of actin dynamics isoform X5 [Trematomus bernacchii]
MSWLQSLRDEFTLRPFEIEQTRSDSAAMASGPPEGMANQEPAEVAEECSGKKKSKFQTFKKLFARKKRKEPPAAGGDAGLKASQSTDNVGKTSENNTLTRSEKEKGSGSKISLGGKALSHDSVFVSDSSETNDALGASQESIHGKVKSLQLQLKQAIRLGSPPSIMCVKRADDAGTMSEDDGLPCSPPEYNALHTVMNKAQRNSRMSLEGVDSGDDQQSWSGSSRAVSPLVVPGDFSQPASPFGCLDNSAAKHKLGLRHKACNRRKHVSRLELKPEGESVLDGTLNASITADSEEQDQENPAEGVRADELKPKEEREEEEEEEEEPKHSRLSDEEEEDECEAEQDVSHGPDTSSLTELRLPEEESPDTRPLPSSGPGSRASSPDSPGATPEPPAGPQEYLLDPLSVTFGAEEVDLSGEEDGIQENREEEEEEEEEESSFLQEVLSSLKTPLASCSLMTEGVDLEIKEEVEERDVVEMEGEEVEEEVVEPVGYQAAPVDSILSHQSSQEEEEVSTLSTASCQDVEQEENMEVREEAAIEEEELVVEEVSQYCREEEEDAEEDEPEEQNDTGNTVNKAEEEGRGEEASEGEEEAIGLKKEPEVEEVKVEVEVKEAEEEERVEEAEEAIEEESDDAEEMTEAFPDAAHDDIQLQEEDEGVVVVVGDDGETMDDQVHESQVASDQSIEEEREDGEERMEEVIEMEDGEADQSELDLQEEGGETPHSDMKHVSVKPSSLSLPESHHEPPSPESGSISPSKTSTIHINLLSPSSEKAPSFFPKSPPDTQPKESETPHKAEEQNADTEEETSDHVETVEEEKQSALEEEATLPVSVEEKVNQVSSPTRFTITPAWQRPLSVGDAEESSTPPSSQTTSSSSSDTRPREVEVEVSEGKAEPASPAKVEVVLSPGRARNAGTPTTTSSSSNHPQTPAAASTEESSMVMEGNPDNPFGVRLRKTSALPRFSSEEENTEPSVEPSAQPTSCRVDSPQPISVKPSISQPISNKPALPKKPDVQGDSGGINKRMTDPAAARGASAGSESPSWISLAKQKQKIYKENSLDEEEPERKSSLPMNVSSAASNKTVSALEIGKPAASAEKESRRTLSPPTPVPPQPPKPQSLPCPVPPKPQLPPATAKPAPQPHSPQRSLSPSAPTPVPQKAPSCTSPSKPSPTSKTLTSPPFSTKIPEKSKAPGLPGQTPASQRGQPPPTLPQDEPPWMALAKKKAKAWSEMPQIVQ